jgi:histidine ammonia-lyase
MAENTLGIIAIELLATCQGINFRRPLKTSPMLENVFALVREKISYYDKDRFFAPDITAAKKIIRSGALQRLVDLS